MRKTHQLTQLTGLLDLPFLPLLILLMVSDSCIDEPSVLAVPVMMLLHVLAFSPVSLFITHR